MNKMTRRNAWQRLRESTQGPTVTVQLPREWAEELMRSLMTSLEIEDMGGEDPEMTGEPHMEPDGDDVPGGGPDMGADDELDFGGDDDAPAGDDSDEDDDDREEEALDFSHGATDGMRPKTAYNESAFARLSRRLIPAAAATKKAPAGRRKRTG